MESNYASELKKNGVIGFVPSGNSMWPIIKNRKHSVVVLAKTEKLKPLDVALYIRADGTFVLHRVMEITEQGYIMCGDSQTSLETVLEDQVIGYMSGFYKGKRYIESTDPEYLDRVKKWYGNSKRRKRKIKCFYRRLWLKGIIKRIFCGKPKNK